MGLLWWKNNNNNNNNSNSNSKETKQPQQTSSGQVVLGMNGAEEVKRPSPIEVAVFEFGSVAASADKVTLAGYCPVSDELEPCRWEILTSQDSDAPQFRVVF